MFFHNSLLISLFKSQRWLTLMLQLSPKGECYPQSKILQVVLNLQIFNGPLSQRTRTKDNHINNILFSERLRISSLIFLDIMTRPPVSQFNSTVNQIDSVGRISKSFQISLPAHNKEVLTHIYLSLNTLLYTIRFWSFIHTFPNHQKPQTSI